MFSFCLYFAAANLVLSCFHMSPKRIFILKKVKLVLLIGVRSHPLEMAIIKTCTRAVIRTVAGFCVFFFISSKS